MASLLVAGKRDPPGSWFDLLDLRYGNVDDPPSEDSAANDEFVRAVVARAETDFFHDSEAPARSIDAKALRVAKPIVATERRASRKAERVVHGSSFPPNRCPSCSVGK